MENKIKVPLKGTRPKGREGSYKKNPKGQSDERSQMEERTVDERHYVIRKPLNLDSTMCWVLESRFGNSKIEKNRIRLVEGELDVNDIITLANKGNFLIDVGPAPKELEGHCCFVGHEFADNGREMCATEVLARRLKINDNPAIQRLIGIVNEKVIRKKSKTLNLPQIINLTYAVADDKREALKEAEFLFDIHYEAERLYYKSEDKNSFRKIRSERKKQAGKILNFWVEQRVKTGRLENCSDERVLPLEKHIDETSLGDAPYLSLGGLIGDAILIGKKKEIEHLTFKVLDLWMEKQTGFYRCGEMMPDKSEQVKGLCGEPQTMALFRITSAMKKKATEIGADIPSLPAYYRNWHRTGAVVINDVTTMGRNTGIQIFYRLENNRITVENKDTLAILRKKEARARRTEKTLSYKELTEPEDLQSDVWYAISAGDEIIGIVNGTMETSKDRSLLSEDDILNVVAMGADKDFFPNDCSEKIKGGCKGCLFKHCWLPRCARKLAEKAEHEDFEKLKSTLRTKKSNGKKVFILGEDFI